MPKRKLPSGGKSSMPNGKSRAPPPSSGGGSGKRRGPLTFDLGGDHIDDASLGDNDEAVEQRDEDELEVEERETAEEKRVRLAKSYLEQIGRQIEESSESDEDDEGDDEGVNMGDRLGARLERERLKATGQLRREVAGHIKAASNNIQVSRILHTHRQLPVTCVALGFEEKVAYSGSKDNSVVRWDLESGKATYLSPRWSHKSASKTKAHEKEVLSLAVSSDGRYVTAGNRAKEILVWDGRTNTLVKTFTGHRDAVSALTFRLGSHSLYSGSCDRCVKHWNLDDMAYVETLYGHQSDIMAIDAGRKERAITVGRDRTVRLWKLPEDSQLVYKGGHQDGNSIDCVAMLSEDSFITGGDDGCLSLWHIEKKKPVAVVPQAHGPSSPWIVSVAALRSSDLVISGSSDGFLRLWRAALHPPCLEQVAAVPLAGFINSIQVTPSGRMAVVGVGQEHRLGRWERIKEGRNGVHLIPLPMPEEEEMETLVQI